VNDGNGKKVRPGQHENIPESDFAHAGQIKEGEAATECRQEKNQYVNKRHITFHAAL
jgi:hypothetical protein